MTNQPTYEKLLQKVMDLEKEVVERKKDEEALRETEEKYRVLFEITRDAIFVIDETGSFVDVNNAACESLGYARKELLQLSNRQIDDGLKGYEAFVKVRNGDVDKITFNVNQRRKDGTALPVEITSSLIKNEKRFMALAIARDIPERKMFVNELRKHHKRLEELNCKRNNELNKINKALQLEIENRKQVEGKTKIVYAELEQIFNITPSGIRLVDKNFNVIKLNQSLSVLSGITMDEAKGKKCYETFPSSLCNTPMCVLTRILGGEELIEVEVEKKCVDGAVIPCILSVKAFRGYGGELIGMVESITDITARKKVENELQDTVKDLRKVLRGTIQAMAFGRVPCPRF